MLQSLTGKVTLVSSLFLVFIVITGVLAFENLDRIRETARHMSEHVVEEVHADGHFFINVHRAIAESYAFGLTGEIESRDEALEALNEAREELTELGSFPESDTLDPTIHEQEQAIQARRQALFDRLQAAVTGLSQQSSQPDPADAAFVELEELEDVATQLDLESDAVLDKNIELATNSLSTNVANGQIAAISAFSVFTIIIMLGVVWLRFRVVRTINTLATSADQVAGGNIDQDIAITADDEIGRLQRSFKTMVASLRYQRTSIEERNRELETSLATQQQLLETVEQLSTPLLPVLEGVVVLPIIGSVDTRRAQDIMDTLLHGVARQRARMAIMDITGIASIDTHTISLLLQAMQGVELLGARAVLAGVSAEIAQLIVQQNINLGDLQTYQDLRTAIEAAITQPSNYRN